MSAETAGYIHQLNEDAPTGGESISFGDDHLRVIKTAVKGTFPSVTGEVTATHTDLNKVSGLVTEVAQLRTDVDGIDEDAHGNVASCYWNPAGGPVGALLYSHSVTEVIANPDDPTGMQTRVNFAAGTLDGDPHYSFNLTPVNGTARPTIITVVGVAIDHLAFLSWQLVGDVWTQIPGAELSFSMMVTDMAKAQ